jgi:ankyrin repeat protein
MLLLLVDVETKDIDYGWTALNHVANKGTEVAVQLLLENGANANGTADISTRTSPTPLELAVWRGREAVVQLLLEKGADPSKQDDDKQTALHLAATGGHEAVVQQLLEKGANTT